VNTADLTRIAELLATTTGPDRDAIRRQAVRATLEAQPMARVIPVTDAQVDAVIAGLDAS
jgi:hypothetical protein